MVTGSYFLGTLTPTGYADFFEQLLNDESLTTIILKCGPWCSKQVLSDIASLLDGSGMEFERVSCAGNPAQLDAVICPQAGFAVADGVPPHLIDARIPVARQEIVSLASCYDRAALLRNKSRLTELYEQRNRYTARARRFLSAAGSLAYDIERTASSFLIRDKLNRYIRNLGIRFFPRKGELPGRETVRFLSAVTPDGIHDYALPNFGGCAHRQVFADRYGAMASAALDLLREEALTAGLDIVSCRSPLSAHDKLEAVYIPSLSMAFLAGGCLTCAEVEDAHNTYDRRFYDAFALSGCQKRLAFCRKAASELLSEACSLLGEARTVMLEAERIYRDAVKEECLEKVFDIVAARAGLK